MKFYKETNFKETPIGRIPKDWDVTRLNNVLLLLRNGLTAEQNKDGIGYPVTRIETISEEKIDPYKVGYVAQINEKDLCEYKLCEGDILFSHINSVEHIGKTAIYEGMPPLLLHGMNLLLLRPDKNKIHPKYLLFLLRLFKLKKIFWAISKKAVNQASINQTELGGIYINLPPLSEQQMIADILSVVDLAIQKTDEIIAKTERLKKGLMQTLLTRGIGHKEYKETPIGKIPKTWQIVKLEDVCEQRSEIVQPSENNNELFVGLEHISPGETRLRNFARSSDIKSSKFRFYAGDILYGKLRPYLDKAVIADFNGICSTDLLVLKPKSNVLKEFLIYVLHSGEFIKHAVATMRGTNHPRTSWSAISKFKFGLPEHLEQQKIADILLSFDKKLEIEKHERKKLELIKRGLMDLLLTGKVRVEVG